MNAAPDSSNPAPVLYTRSESDNSLERSNQTGLHFNDYLRVIKNRWAVVLTIILIVTVTSYFYTRSQTKMYASSAVLKVDDRNPDIRVFGSSYEQFDTVFFQTQAALIQSQKLLYPVVEENNLTQVFAEQRGLQNPLTLDQAYNVLRSMIRVSPVKSTKLIELTVTSSDPEQAATLANLVSMAFERSRLREITEREQAGLRVLADEIEKQRAVHAKAKEKVDELRITYKLNEQSLGSANTLQDMELQRLEAALTDARNDLAGRRIRLEKVNNLTIDELENTLTVIGLEDGTTAGIRNRYLAAKTALTTLMEQGFDDNHPRIKAAVAELDELRTQLNRLIEGIKNGLSIDLTVAQTKVEDLEKNVLLLREKNRAQRTEQIQPYQDALREAETQKMMLDTLEARYRQQMVDAQIGIRPVEIINRAEPNRVPVSPNVRLAVGLSIVIGIVLGIAFAFFIEYLDTSVKTMDDVERFIGANVLTIIPQGVHTLNLEGPDSPSAEGYRILRTKMNIGSEGGPRTVAIVSGGPAEGKTTTSFNLSYVVAQSELPTLLIDADLRRPSVHKVLGLKNEIGLSDYLLGRLSLEECITPGPLPFMHILLAGKIKQDQLSAFNPTRLREILAWAKDRYAFILFDTPPILGISEASMITQDVDATLLVIQHRRYPRNVMLRSKRVIEEVGGRLAGVVLNRVHLKSDEAYYYYTSYYNYYGNSGKTKEQIRQQVRKNKKNMAKGQPTVPQATTPASDKEVDAY
jgi:capsular exopolysaccharide synthesis family protein